MPDLPLAVQAALAAPGPAEQQLTIGPLGMAVASLAWGEPNARPLLLLHGVGTSAEQFWRLGPALAAAAWRVVAPDLPGHGRTGRWQGRHRFAETAADVVAFARVADLDRPDLAVVGHSWGGMVAAAIPSAGLRPARLVILDPPAVPLVVIGAMADQSDERRFDDLDEAIATVTRNNPGWDDRDIRAKAIALTQVDEAAARSVLLENGDWDGGLASLLEPEARGMSTWLIRGDPAAGGYIPDDRLAAFRAAIGESHVVTLEGAPHSPHRTHPDALMAALLRALG
jgi:pimeloyl-ACP methyl ester carboxylesterase